MYFCMVYIKLFSMNVKIIVALLMLLFVTTSCVTKKKYLIAENARLEAIQRGNDLSKLLDERRADISGLNKRINELQRDTANLNHSIRNYKSMLNSNLSEQENLNAMLQEKINELNEREKIINDLQSLIDEQKANVQNILNNVKNALMGFNSDELSVMEKDGKVYVAMSDKLLFESGSAKVDKRGEQALAKLAEVLIKQADIDVNIEGHTDDKPIKTVQFKDNWDLSVIRATSVVRILTEKYKVGSLQIVPSGRGEYLPVADNKTAEGRAKNRRTEIIISPKLDKLFELLKKY